MKFANLLKNTNKEEAKDVEKINKQNFKHLTKTLKDELPKTKQEDSKLKQQLIFQILKYQDNSRFTEFIKTKLKINFTETALQKKKIDFLQNVLDRIRINLDNRNMDNFYKAMLVNATLSFETLMENFYTVEGLSDNLMNNPHFLDCVERYKIENIGKMPSLPPSLQIIFIVSQTALVCHQLAIKNENKKEEFLTPPKLSKKDENLLK